jgi:hypothetical protein
MPEPTYSWTEGSVMGDLTYRPSPRPVCDTVDVPLLRKQLEWATKSTRTPTPTRFR